MTELKTPRLIKRAIKEYVRDVLKNKTSAGANVFISRSLPTQHEALPSILVYTTGENVSLFDVSYKRYRRSMNLRIECVTIGDDDEDLDLKLEEMGEVVEDYLDRDETFSGLINKVELAST